MQLPDNFIENNTLDNMPIGSFGFIPPWGMYLENGECFLNGNYTYSDAPGGTVQLKITRINAGYIAHIHEMKDDYKWKEGLLFMGDFTPLKVIGFRIESPKQRSIGMFCNLKKIINWN